MQKENIVKNNFYIKRILKVIKSKNKKHHKILTVKSRHSDAFVYIISGACTYTVDGKEFTVKQGDILYLSHNAEYNMYIRDDKYSFIFCDFEFDSDKPRECMPFYSKNSSFAENLFVKLLNTYGSDSASAFEESLSALYDIYGFIKRTQSPKYVENGQKMRIAEAKRYIDFHFSDSSLSIEDVAQRIDMSEVYFRKLFKNEYGQSPSQYLAAVRLRKAIELMRYPFMSVEECAMQSGFSSQQYFSRVFKKNIGDTPAHYRKKIK